MYFELQELKITCDNQECDFEVSEPDTEKAKEFIGKACPKCGRPLCSLDDFHNWEAVRTAQMIANKLGCPHLMCLIDALNLIRETIDIQEAVEKGSNGRKRAIVHYQLHGRMGIKRIELQKVLKPKK